jgi:hypothetical protein
MTDRGRFFDSGVDGIGGIELPVAESKHKYIPIYNPRYNLQTMI